MISAAKVDDFFHTSKKLVFTTEKCEKSTKYGTKISNMGRITQSLNTGFYKIPAIFIIKYISVHS